MAQTIPAIGSNYLPTDSDVSPLERIGLARGAWREGNLEAALLILDSVLQERVSPLVCVEACVAKAAVRADQGYWFASLECLERAAPLIDQATPLLQGCFFNQRARVNRQLQNIDRALTDYAGAAIRFEQAEHREYEGAVAINVACLRLELGDLDCALREADHAISIYDHINSPYLAQAYDTKANILLALGQINDALSSVEIAIGMNVDNAAWHPTFLITRGKIKAAMRDAAARNDFDAAITAARSTERPAAISEACCAAIESLDLPLEDMIAYYLQADQHGGDGLRRCARILIQAIPVGTIEEMEVDMVRRALIKAEGSITRAAETVGLTHKGIDYVINRHPNQLMHLRKDRRIRRKSLIKKNKSRLGS